MAARIHPDQLIDRLRRDRRRCFIITGRPGEGKTALAEKMVDRYQGQRLDLLATFSMQTELVKTLDTYTPQRFLEFLEPYAGGHLVLVDEMEFLWHRWDEGEKSRFLRKIAKREKPAFLGFFLTPDPVIEELDMPDQDGRTRVFSLHDLQAL